MSEIIEKVTAFIIQPSSAGDQLLLFQHPSAGIQIPAGTITLDESPTEAVLREAAEETGLEDLSIQRYLGASTEQPATGSHWITQMTQVFSRPDPDSFAWAQLPRGLTVKRRQQTPLYSHITYLEYDQVPQPQFITYQIMGWVPNSALAASARRHFFRLRYAGISLEQWEVSTDHHRFTLF